MSISVNLARMTTATTGTGTITLGSAVSGYLSFAGAGVTDGDVVSYGIKDGSNSEVGTGTYTASGTTLTRTVLKSTNADAAISLSGNAEVYVTALAEDIFGQTGDVERVELARSELGAGGGIFDFTSIAQTYDHLEVILRLRSSVSATFDACYVYFNNDTTLTNYESGDHTAGNSHATATTSNTLVYSNGATAAAGYFSTHKIFIPFYANTNFSKIANQLTTRRDATGTTTLYFQYGAISWESAAAISRITIQPDGYATDNFVQYSTAILYGIRTVS